MNTSADMASQYKAARETAAWMDLSARGRLKLGGADRVRFLHGQCTNDIEGLKPGRGCYAANLTNKGRMRGDFVVLMFEDHILLDTEPVAREPLANALQRYIIADDVVIEDVSGAMGALSFSGPERVCLVASLNIPGLDLRAIPEARYAHVGAGDCILVQSWHTGLGDLDLIGPRRTIERLKADLSGFAVELGAVAFEVLRVEAGIPRFGADMDEHTIPNEAGIENRAVSYEKGCYIGQETISRIRSIGHVNRHLVGLRLDRAQPPAGNEKILVGGEEIGYITTAVGSPRLGVIALGYVRRGHERPGARVLVAGQPAVVSALPFTT